MKTVRTKRVLVALDDSERAPVVFAAAFDLARCTRGSLRLFHALSIPQMFPPAAHVEATDALPEFLRNDAKHRLEAFQAAADDLVCDIEIEEASIPWRSILSAADRYGADLVVLGSHGHTFIDGVLGTTAAKVVDHSRSDVLVVHRRAPVAPTV